MSAVTTELSELPTVTKTRWRIDPARSSIEFRHTDPLGAGDRQGPLRPLRRDARPGPGPRDRADDRRGQLDTKNKLRDKHLRSEDFFDVEHSPEVRFVSDAHRLMASG